jgi:antitoxin (DNA-binding transcriptional repressor) of toxin-antitoxin stability system
MVETTVAKLRSQLAAILDLVRFGETVLIKRNGTPVAILNPAAPGARKERIAIPGSPSRAPRVLDPGPVIPIRLRPLLRHAPSQELSNERE